MYLKPNFSLSLQLRKSPLYDLSSMAKLHFDKTNSEVCSDNSGGQRLRV